MGGALGTLGKHLELLISFWQFRYLLGNFGTILVLFVSLESCFGLFFNTFGAFDVHLVLSAIFCILLTLFLHPFGALDKHTFGKFFGLFFGMFLAGF